MADEERKVGGFGGFLGFFSMLLLDVTCLGLELLTSGFHSKWLFQATSPQKKKKGKLISQITCMTRSHQPTPFHTITPLEQDIKAGTGNPVQDLFCSNQLRL